MVIDTSAIVAILFGEPEVEALAEAIERVAVRLMSAASVFEAAIVVESEWVILVRARRDASSTRTQVCAALSSGSQGSARSGRDRFSSPGSR
jgi:uncharacterized protein with PIN domain